LYLHPESVRLVAPAGHSVCECLHPVQHAAPHRADRDGNCMSNTLQIHITSYEHLIVWIPVYYSHDLDHDHLNRAIKGGHNFVASSKTCESSRRRIVVGQQFIIGATCHRTGRAGRQIGMPQMSVLCLRGATGQGEGRGSSVERWQITWICPVGMCTA
jgi:hypothetical protein